MPKIISRNVKQDHPDYPSALLARLGPKAPKQMAVLGNISILRNKPIGVFCSDDSSQDQLIVVDGLIRKWCGEDLTLISGLHTKQEKINSKTILSFQRPAILCLGVPFSKRHLTRPVKKGLEANQLLLLCPFENETRITKETDLLRNLIVASLSDSILVAPWKGDDAIENLIEETREWNIPTTVLEMTKKVIDIDVATKGESYTVVKRVLPLFSKVEKMGQIIGENGLGQVRPPRD